MKWSRGSISHNKRRGEVHYITYSSRRRSTPRDRAVEGKFLHPCAFQGARMLPLPASRLLRATVREAGVVLASLVTDAANWAPEIECDDGASVWNVDRLWIGAVGCRRHGPVWGGGWPVMQREALEACCVTARPPPSLFRTPPSLTRSRCAKSPAVPLDARRPAVANASALVADRSACQGQSLRHARTNLRTTQILGGLPAAERFVIV